MTYLSSEWRQKLLDVGFPSNELNLGVAEEVLRMLPKEIWKDCQKYGLVIECLESYWLKYMHYDEAADLELICGDTIANAAAALYCYLAENKLLPAA